jgi:hypothetical protein
MPASFEVPRISLPVTAARAGTLGLFSLFLNYFSVVKKARVGGST